MSFIFPTTRSSLVTSFFTLILYFGVHSVFPALQYIRGKVNRHRGELKSPLEIHIVWDIDGQQLPTRTIGLCFSLVTPLAL
jgi:hypothetical protein